MVTVREDGRCGVVPYVVKNIQAPPPPTEEMISERRRIRAKAPG